MVVRFQGALPERLVDNISHKHDRALTGRRRRQFQQQASPGLPVSFAGMPETVVTYLMKAFGQHVKEETPQELNTL
jgi:hypothetical protein